MEHAANVNECAATLAWLNARLGLSDDATSSSVREAWATTRSQMLRGTQAIVQTQNWISDYWLARSTMNSALNLAPRWDPPHEIHEWPSLGVGDVVEQSGLVWRRTTPTPSVGPSVGADDASDAALSFGELRSGIKQHRDVPMKQVEHVRAWLGTALGHLLMSVPLTPAEDVAQLAENSLTRLRLAQKIPLAEIVNEYEERRLDLLYNLRVTPEGFLQSSEIMIGQGEEWREHWGWLSDPLATDEMLDALRLAARLLRCEALAQGLVGALGAEDDYLRTISLAVLRRWVLTTKVMMWLETALSHPWESVRPEDLACFAFNALKPDWPRRVVAVSHRSADVKSRLISMDVWRAGRCAIDANYVPSWETNTGMMWGLFAATPAIVRVESKTYRDSVWCRRELELSQYLMDHEDFLAERWLLDLDDSELDSLDSVTAAWSKETPEAPDLGPLFREFPPLCQVWTTEPLPSWEAALLRAAAALRVMSVFLGSPQLANHVAADPTPVLQTPTPPPTNDPGGWAAYVALFDELRSVFGAAQGELPVRLPEDYSAEDVEVDRELSNRIPDLSTGSPALADILLALEWLRGEWPAMVEDKRGQFLMIDCRPMTREAWESAPSLSLMRGLAAVRLNVPLWFVQSAGQDVETWPFVGERPIFTQHVESQFAWMMEIFLPRSAACAEYPQWSGLELSDDVRRRCAGT
jgi:hypothetical protein